MSLTCHHATAFLDPGASQPAEELRRIWDPEMARQIAADITLIYPEEITDPRPADSPSRLAHLAEHSPDRTPAGTMNVRKGRRTCAWRTEQTPCVANAPSGRCCSVPQVRASRL